MRALWAVVAGVAVAWVVARARRETFEPSVPPVAEPQLRPSKFRSQGRAHYYQIPADPRGTLLVLPGCSRWGPGFWPRGPACPECVGLTEDVSHTKQALALGYAVLVGWPVDRAFPGQYCWSTPDDGPSIVKVLDDFLARHGLADKPVYVMGASSGGTVALRLPALLRAHGSRTRVSGIVALVATKLEVREMLDDRNYVDFPPIVWITLGEAREIQAAKRHVVEYGRRAPAAMAASTRRVVGASYFADRHPGVDARKSAELVAALKKAGVLRADGSFATDPKKNRRWTARATLPWMRGDPSLAWAPTKNSALLQALLVAYAGHEHVSDFLTAALMWFESGGQASFGDLARRFRVWRPALLSAARVTGEPRGPAFSP